MDASERLRHLRAIWNWLPSFRAVAETQHLHKASRILSVSPSALSRTIRLLEDRLGEVLFERRGRMLVLTPAGAELRDAVRDSIRRIDDGLSRVRAGRLACSVHLSSASSAIDAALIPALWAVHQSHPKLIPHLHRLSSEDVTHRLLGGELDVAFLLGPPVDRRLTADHLGYAKCGIYCGPRHPFFGASDLSLKMIVGQAFLAIAAPGAPGQYDGWPSEHPRNIAMYVSDASLACQACQEVRMLAVLPDATVALHGLKERLYRLPVNVLGDIPIYSTRRAPISRSSWSDAVICAVRQQIDKMSRIGLRSKA
jgi:DNA-binding transcriptional LysR family regulator